MKFILANLITILSFGFFAQEFKDTNDPREIKSLLSHQNGLKGFGGADLKITDMMAERTAIVGGYGGVLVNRRYMLGVAGYGISTNPKFDGVLPEGFSELEEMRKLTVNGGYAGLLIGGMIFTRELIHISIPILLGAGAIQISDDDFFQTSTDTEYTVERSTSLLLEPGAQIEFNLTHSMRIAAGVTYRYVDALELINLSNEDLTNWSGILSFRFGRF